MFHRRRARSSRPAQPSTDLVAEMDATREAVLVERQPLARALAVALHGRRVQAQWDPVTGALHLVTEEGDAGVLLCDDGTVAAQVAAMTALEETRVDALALSGRVHLELWSSSWRYRLAGIPAG